MGADPASRPRSATAFVDELERAFELTRAAAASRPTAPWVPSRTRPVRRSRFVPLAALLLALVIAGAAVLAFTGGDSTSTKGRPAAAHKKRAHKKKSQKPAAAAPAPAASAPQPTGNDAATGSALNDQGYKLTLAGNYSEAVPVLQRAVRAFPPGTTDINYQFALFNLGHALRLAGRPAEAIPVLEQRLKNPNQRATVQAELDAARQAAGQN
jgi:serine/threonine-protein kinase